MIGYSSDYDVDHHLDNFGDNIHVHIIFKSIL